MKNRQSLSFRELRNLASFLCAKLHLSLIDECELYTQYFADVPQPIVIDDDGTRIWIDRYYAAYQTGCGEVTYVYLTRAHILEETEDRSVLPDEIQTQFNEALSSMNSLCNNMWFGTRFREQDVLQMCA